MYHIPVKLFCNPLIPVVDSEHGTNYMNVDIAREQKRIKNC